MACSKLIFPTLCLDFHFFTRVAHRHLGTLGVYWLVKDASELQMIVYREQEVGGRASCPLQTYFFLEAFLKLAKMSFLTFGAKFNL